MLVLTRKKGEKILVGKDVEITIVNIRGSNYVRVGIEAPREMKIYREELKPKEKA